MGRDLDQILPLTFSGVRAGDETEVLKLIEAGGLHTEDLDPSRLRNFLVARKGGRICGVAGLEIAGGCALMRSLTVAEDQRGQGVGARLLEAVERYARMRRVEYLYLLVAQAENYFLKRGFAAVDRTTVPESLQSTPVFQVLSPGATVCMVRHLPG
jgi:N-acetylglutamate synthase-like GNAT family acetyltransferase